MAMSSLVAMISRAIASQDQLWKGLRLCKEFGTLLFWEARDHLKPML
jgi:hypothetical protein